MMRLCLALRGYVFLGCVFLGCVGLRFAFEVLDILVVVVVERLVDLTVVMVRKMLSCMGSEVCRGGRGLVLGRRG